MIVFETTGEIDPRSFTIMGLTSKPRDKNPIGYFGTGLKYAIAVLARLDAQVHLYIGRDEYVFVRAPGEFRGQAYEKLVMRCKRWRWKHWRDIELPYTTEYGRNWKMWQVFRELEANTRDEHGRTWKHDGAMGPGGEQGKTRIVVEHADFDLAWEHQDEVFLPGALRARGQGQNYGHVEVFPVSGDGKAVYWRGLKVYEMKKPGIFTYNFVDPINITEDRTLANEWEAKFMLGRWLALCDREDVIERIVGVGENHWEHEVAFPDHMPPSVSFHRVMLRHPKRANATAWGYFSRYDRRTSFEVYRPFEVHPLPWKVQGATIVDNKGRALFDAPYGYEGRWQLLAEALLQRLNPEPELSTTEVVEVVQPDELVAAMQAGAPEPGAPEISAVYVDEAEAAREATTEFVAELVPQTPSAADIAAHVEQNPPTPPAWENPPVVGDRKSDDGEIPF